MFNSIDFSSAFKQLNELDDIEKSLKLNESLNEQGFNLSRIDGRDDVDAFLNDEEDDTTVRVYDLDAADESELDESNVGKILLQCPCCETIICKEPSDVELPEESGAADGSGEKLVSVGTECPVCRSEEGYKIIGKVAPYEETTIEIEPKDDSEAETGGADIISIKDKLHDIESELDELPLAEAVESKKKVPAFKKSKECTDGCCEGKVRDFIDDVKDKANVAVSKASNGTLGKTYAVERDAEGPRMNGPQYFRSKKKALSYGEQNGGIVDEISNRENTELNKAKGKLINKMAPKTDITKNSFEQVGHAYDTIKAAEKVQATRTPIADFGPDKKNLEIPSFMKNRKKSVKESTEDAKNSAREMNAILGDSSMDTTAQVESLNEVFGSAEIPGWRGIERQAPEKQIQILKCAANELKRVGRNGLNAFNADFSKLTPDNPESIQKAIEYVKSYVQGKSIFVTEALAEGLNDVQLDTDHEHISIHSEPKAENGEEMIAPLDFQAANEIADAQPNDAFDQQLDNVEANDTAPVDEVPMDSFNNEAPMDGETLPNEGDVPMDELQDDEKEEVPVDEFDEESFDRIGESYLKKVYENVNSYKTTSIKESDDSLVCEGVIKFNSGRSGVTQFILEGQTITPSGDCSILVENAQITPGKKSMTLNGNITEGKFVPNSLSYNYKVGKNTVFGRVNI